MSDFEAELGWAIGLDRKHTYRVTRVGPNVVVTSLDRRSPQPAGFRASNLVE